MFISVNICVCLLACFRLTVQLYPASISASFAQLEMVSVSQRWFHKRLSFMWPIILSPRGIRSQNTWRNFYLYLILFIWLPTTKKPHDIDEEVVRFSMKTKTKTVRLLEIPVCKSLKRRRTMCIGTHWFCCFTVRPRKHTVPFVTGLISHVCASMLWVGKVFTGCHCVFLAETLSKNYDPNFMGSCSLSLPLNWGTKYKVATITCGKQAQHSFSSNGYASILWSRVTISVSVKFHQSVYVVCGFLFFLFFFLLGIQMVDFLCTQSAVRLLPYRDATERRVSGQREEERRTNKTHFSGLNLLTAESV